jgi:uncharacterized protein YndB with AHSA1/START domain
MTGLIATAEIELAAPARAVWQALTDPEKIKAYFLGTQIETDWVPGHPITWSGEYHGKAYQDHGTVIEVQPEHSLVITHFSPMVGLPDVPENYHTITYSLAERDGTTHLTLTQDNNGSAEEAEHSSAVWQDMLVGLKHVVEGAET